MMSVGTGAAAEITLYHSPGACSRITLVALEEIGLAYADRGLSLVRGDQRRPDYLAINPKGKVPVLLVGPAVLTETPAILHFLAAGHENVLLPVADDAVRNGQALSDLVWIAGTLHPLAHRILRPLLYSQADEAGVRSLATEQLRSQAERIESRLRDQAWWYGEAWSIADAYLSWVFSTAARYGFPLTDYPAIGEHGTMVAKRPSFQRAVARERVAVARDGLPLPPNLAL